MAATTIKAVFHNEFAQNQLMIDNGDGTGLVFFIFDPSGSHGAENFLPLLHSLCEPLKMSSEQLVAFIKDTIKATSPQFQLMDIEAHANWEFVMQAMNAPF